MWINWHGGANYSDGYAADMIEVSSLREAIEICDSRYRNQDGSTPCVDESSGASVYLDSERPEETDNPDRLIIRTARGKWKAI